MLLDLKTLVDQYNLRITGVIHAGAHLGEEAQDYQDLGITNVWWIEANPFVIPKLQSHLDWFGHHLIEALLTDQDREQRSFNISNDDGMTSSIFEYGQIVHDTSPEAEFVVSMDLESRTLDSLVKEYDIKGCNFLNMDLQGAELLVLSGAEEILKTIDYVYTEVSIVEVYIGCAQLDVLDRKLHNFTRVETSMTYASWGDALYCRSAP